MTSNIEEPIENNIEEIVKNEDIEEEIKNLWKNQK